MKKTSILFILVLVITASAALVSCKKEKPTILIMEVRDGDNLVVADSDVRLFVLPTPVDPDTPQGQIVHGELRIDTTLSTNSAGKITVDFTDYYELGQSGLFVLNYEATKGILFGEGIVKVEPEEETNKNVIIE